MGPDEGTLSISVSVQDADGDLIQQGLSPANFEFQNVTLTPEGGSPVEVTSATVVSIEVVPPSEGGAATVVVDFDCSGSMQDNDPGAVGRIAGGQALIDHMDGIDDWVSIIAFDGSSSGGLSRSHLLQEFTTDKGLMEAALQLLWSSGSTPLWESCLDALELLQQRLGLGNGGNVVLLTDGEPSSGWSQDPQAAIDQALAQGAAIYTVGLGTDIDFTELQDVAAQTGGAFAEASDSDALEAAFDGLGAGVTVGYIRVEGHLTYPTQPAGRYTVAGEVVTTVGGASVTTPFSFTADID